MIKEILYQGAKIRYKDQGEGIPIVLLHGYLLSLDIFNEFAGELAVKYRVVSIDLPGHGKSDVIADIHDMHLMAESVDAVLKSIEIDKFILVGHSMGGYITLAYLNAYPDKLIGFSLFHSTPFADNDEKKINRDRECELVLSGKKEAVSSVSIPKMFADDNLEKFKDDIIRAKEIAMNTADNGIVAMLQGMKERPERLDLLKETKIPFLLVLGKKDNYISYDDISQKLVGKASFTKLVLENSGHIGYIEEKEKAVLGLHRFIEHI